MRHSPSTGNGESGSAMEEARGGRPRPTPRWESEADTDGGEMMEPEAKGCRKDWGCPEARVVEAGRRVVVGRLWKLEAMGLESGLSSGVWRERSPYRRSWPCQQEARRLPWASHGGATEAGSWSRSLPPSPHHPSFSQHFECFFPFLHEGGRGRGGKPGPRRDTEVDTGEAEADAGEAEADAGVGEADDDTGGGEAGTREDPRAAQVGEKWRETEESGVWRSWGRGCPKRSQPWRDVRSRSGS